MERAAKNGLLQIKEKHYGEDARRDGYSKLICIGIGFYKKNCKVMAEEECIKKREVPHSCAYGRPFCRYCYLIPVVAIPSTRYFWKNRNIRKIGIRERLDMAKKEPVADSSASINIRRASVTVK